MDADRPSRGVWVRSALARGTGLLAFWLLLARPWGGSAGDAGWTDLVVAVLATVAATWASLRLLAPTPGRIRFGALVKLAARFLWQSLVGGVDVARRAFHPRLPLDPGYLAYPVRLPGGPRRDAFGALTSLMPGTLPVGTDADDALVYHCLDLRQPVSAGLARDEALMADVRGGERARD
jgi:multicomponent Na+:H+ antiporter subunit E